MSNTEEVKVDERTMVMKIKSAIVVPRTYICFKFRPFCFLHKRTQHSMNTER